MQTALYDHWSHWYTRPYLENTTNETITIVASVTGAVVLIIIIVNTTCIILIVLVKKRRRQLLLSRDMEMISIHHDANDYVKSKGILQ